MTQGGNRYSEFSDRMDRRAEREAGNVRRLLAEIESRHAEASRAGRNFTAVSEGQLVRKLRSANSPMITFQSWDSAVAPGGALDYTVGITNPDPDPAVWLFAHLFVGPGTIAADIRTALAAVDDRFPRLTEPAFDGLTIDAGMTETIDFTVPIPGGVEASNYLGNAVLFGADWHDPATYLDQGLFIFSVT